MINIQSSIPIIGIYKITSPSGKIYIGQSVNIKNRWNQYRLLYKTIMGPMLFNSFKKYGVENHIFEVIEECILEQLNEREEFWILFYNSQNKGLNLNSGGNNKKMNNDTKKKIRKALLGRKILWDAGRKKGYIMSEDQKNKLKTPKSAETKQKMRKPRSEEAKINMKYPKSEEAKQNMKWERPLRKCPHCYTQGKGAVMDRFHFNNCKYQI